jgi:hypothetical protein
MVLRDLRARATWVITLTWVDTGLAPIGILHLARIGTDELADPRQPARLRWRDADRGLLARVAHRVAQAIEAVALQNAHVAAGVIGPDGLRPRALGNAREPLGNLGERCGPGYRLELA